MNAQRITQALNGRWFGGYGLAFCPSHNNRRTPALSLKDGVDGILLAHCHAGCAFSEVLDALKGMGLIEGRSDWRPPEPGELATQQLLANAEAKKKAGIAKALWDECLPIAGTLGETYLRGRAITCELPETLRFHPAIKHPCGRYFPAMVAEVEGANRFAVHRTFLGEIGKAHVAPNKMALGATRGGAVRLSDGRGPLVVCEGVETGLSLSCGLLRGPATIWAGIGSGMKSIQLPELPGRLVIASDGDEPGQRASATLATRASALGWNVSLLPAPIGRDWNDVLQAEVAA